MSLLGTMIGGFLADGELPAPMGTAYKALLPYQTFRTKTRDLALAVGSEALADVLSRDRPAGASERPALSPERRPREEPCHPHPAASGGPCSRRTYEGVGGHLPARPGHPFGAINNPGRSCASPGEGPRHPRWRCSIPRAGKVKMVVPPCACPRHWARCALHLTDTGRTYRRRYCVIFWE